MGKKLFLKRAVSFMLFLLLGSALWLAGTSEEVSAAAKSFRGTGKSNVSVSDAEGYDVENQKPIIQYIAFKPNVTGYVTLKFVSDSKYVSAETGLPVPAEGNITLCDGKKKAIGVEEAWYAKKKYAGDDTRTYGVRKGQSYYFKLETWGGVKITANVVKADKSSANSKAKAKNLTKNQKAKGIMIAGEKKADWYKIKLTKGAKIKLSYTAKTMGFANATQYGYKEAGICFTFMMKTEDGKWTAKTKLTPLKSEDEITIAMKDEETGVRYDMEPGTYYVKVEPVNKKSSGYYTLKWSTF